VKTSFRNARQIYIGGAFATGDDDPFMTTGVSNIHFPEAIGEQRRFFFETGSNAIAAQIQGYKELWLPQNFCRATAAIISRKSPATAIRYYADAWEGISSHEKPRAVLLLHFNRYSPQISELAARYRDTETLIIEDFVQAPFDIQKMQGHCAIVSLRKICALEAALAYSPYSPRAVSAPSRYTEVKSEAMQLRQDFLATGNPALDRQHLEKMQAATEFENDPEIRSADQNEIERFAAIDFGALKRKRQDNREDLETDLHGLEDLTCLASDYFFLMVRVQNRDAVRKSLFAQGIFPPIHWADSGHAKDLLSLPIDQRYDARDMQKIAASLRNALAQS
jgi:hypothetical protein